MVIVLAGRCSLLGPVLKVGLMPRRGKIDLENIRASLAIVCPPARIETRTPETSGY
jgi:hypothetical protein